MRRIINAFGLTFIAIMLTFYSGLPVLAAGQGDAGGIPTLNLSETPSTTGSIYNPKFVDPFTGSTVQLLQVVRDNRKLELPSTIEVPSRTVNFDLYFSVTGPAGKSVKDPLYFGPPDKQYFGEGTLNASEEGRVFYYPNEENTTFPKYSLYRGLLSFGGQDITCGLPSYDAQRNSIAVNAAFIEKYLPPSGIGIPTGFPFNVNYPNTAPNPQYGSSGTPILSPGEHREGWISCFGAPADGQSQWINYLEKYYLQSPTEDDVLDTFAYDFPIWLPIRTMRSFEDVGLTLPITNAKEPDELGSPIYILPWRFSVSGITTYLYDASNTYSSEGYSIFGKFSNETFEYSTIGGGDISVAFHSTGESDTDAFSVCKESIRSDRGHCVSNMDLIISLDVLDKTISRKSFFDISSTLGVNLPAGVVSFDAALFIPIDDSIPAKDLGLRSTDTHPALPIPVWRIIPTIQMDRKKDTPGPNDFGNSYRFYKGSLEDMCATMDCIQPGDLVDVPVSPTDLYKILDFAIPLFCPGDTADNTSIFNPIRTKVKTYSLSKNRINTVDGIVAQYRSTSVPHESNPVYIRIIHHPDGKWYYDDVKDFDDNIYWNRLGGRPVSKFSLDSLNQIYSLIQTSFEYEMFGNSSFFRWFSENQVLQILLSKPYPLSDIALWDPELMIGWKMACDK